MTQPEIQDARRRLGAALQRHVSQSEFASMCGLSPNSCRLVRAWEAGRQRPGPERIETIKRLLREAGAEDDSCAS